MGCEICFHGNEENLVGRSILAEESLYKCFSQALSLVGGRYGHFSQIVGLFRPFFKERKSDDLTLILGEMNQMAVSYTV